MRQFTQNFRRTASDRAAEISTKAYNHYLRIKPWFVKIQKPWHALKEAWPRIKNTKNFSV